MYCSVGCATLPFFTSGSDQVDGKDPAVIQLPYPTYLSQATTTLFAKSICNLCVAADRVRPVSSLPAHQANQSRSLAGISARFAAAPNGRITNVLTAKPCSGAAYGGALAFNNGDQQADNTCIIILLG